MTGNVRPGETGIGGSDTAFRTTVWSDVLAAGDPTDPRSRECLEQLLRTYWKPAYMYVRVMWRARVEDAKDLTQAFFARLLEKDAWARLRPERGSFRGYLKRALKHFLINARRHDAARTPAARVLSIEARPDELERLVPAEPSETPEHAFDRTWFNGLLDEAFDALAAELRRQGKPDYYDVFRAFCLESKTASTSVLAGAAPEAASYARIAERLGMQRHDVRNRLSYCRKLLKRILRGRIRTYVRSDDDVERELEEALGA